MLFKNLTIILFAIILSSCAYKKSLQFVNCSDKTAIQNRLALFIKPSKKEINIRKKTKLQSIQTLDKPSVIAKIIQQIKTAPANAKFIAIDLQNYKEVNLTNIIFANQPESMLNNYLLTSKFSQGYFALINVNDKGITIIPPEVFKAFEKIQINRTDLKDVEFVINANNSEDLFGNLKFSERQKFSLFADNIAQPVRLDLREASNMQFNLNKKWIMPVYTIKNTYIKESKISTVHMHYVDNNNSQIYNKKFAKSSASCYFSDSDMKFIQKD